MKKLLFIGHKFHQKTKSADFLLELLQKNYEVTKVYIDPYVTNELTLEYGEYDFVICWQIMFSINKLKSLIKYKKCIFFPMYDGIYPLDKPIWAEYADTKIICFCRYLYEKLAKAGFDCEYIQYFPKPQTVKNFGDEKSLFFWQRIEKIDLKLLSRICLNKYVNKVHLHKALDPEQKFKDYPLEQKITTSEWFDKKEDLYNTMMNSALYMAPRLKEGIGMSFLEAMSLGRCVIAPNNPTMNEYIENGKTGFLYDFNNAKPIELKNIKQIQRNTIDYMANGYKQYNKQKSKIIDWMEEAPKSCKLKAKYETTYKLFGLIPLLKVEEK